MYINTGGRMKKHIDRLNKALSQTYWPGGCGNNEIEHKV
jgi:hypothetical protein